jgi:transcriptional regulator with XRE-family HTH domain
MCRRCESPLPPPPRLDSPLTGGSSEGVDGRIGVAGLSELDINRDRSHSRTRAARELTIGRKLRELRDQRHLTQQEMAAKAGVPRTYISRIENARLLPGPVMLRRIAEALDVEILDLLPPNKNLNLASEPSATEDVFWSCLARYFAQLEAPAMTQVLDHARMMAEHNGSQPYFSSASAVLR